MSIMLMKKDVKDKENWVSTIISISLIMGFLAGMVTYSIINMEEDKLMLKMIDNNLHYENILLCFRDSYMSSSESCTILTGDDTKGVLMPQADNETLTVSHYLIDKKDNEIFILPNHKSIKYEFTSKLRNETILELKDN